GQRLGLRLDRLAVVGRLLEGARSWGAAAERLLADIDAGEMPPTSELETALAEAAALGFAARCLPARPVGRLRQLLHAADDWRRRVAAVLAAAPGCGAAAEAEAAELLGSGLSLGLQLPEAGRLRLWLEAVRWNNLVRSTFARVFAPLEAAAAEAAAAAAEAAAAEGAEAEAAAALAMVAAAAAAEAGPAGSYEKVEQQQQPDAADQEGT
ncbi:hypothetical protein Agub_g4712, partial [Astrephomene gubernaculifera]